MFSDEQAPVDYTVTNNGQDISEDPAFVNAPTVDQIAAALVAEGMSIYVY